MSISGLTSPPLSSTSLSTTQAVEKNLRRVRFSLPEAKLNIDKRSVHGTTKYVNGTLINVTSMIHTTNSDVKVKSTGNGNTSNGIQLKTSCLKANGSNGIPISKDSSLTTASQYKLSLNIRPTSAINGAQEFSPTQLLTTQGQRHSLPTASATNGNGSINRRRTSKSLVNGRNEKSFNTLPIIENSSSHILERKSSSLDDNFDDDIGSGRDEIRRDERDLEHKVMNVTNLTKYKSSDDLRDQNNFKVKNSSVLKLPEALNGSAVNGQKVHKINILSTNTLKVPEFSESKKYRRIFIRYRK